MTTPKEIAERIIKQCDGLRNYQQLFEFDIQFETLARAYLDALRVSESIEAAYLELEKELAAEKADKQRVIDIGVNMQRRVNDRVEAENKILEGTLEEIGADMYVGYKKSCGCPEAAEKCLERLRK